MVLKLHEFKFLQQLTPLYGSFQNDQIYEVHFNTVDNEY